MGYYICTPITVFKLTLLNEGGKFSRVSILYTAGNQDYEKRMKAFIGETYSYYLSREKNKNVPKILSLAFFYSSYGTYYMGAWT